MRHLDEALRYLADKKPVFPVDRNKSPLVEWKEFQKRLPTEEDVRKWWDKWPDANIAMLMGHLSGLMVIDCDHREADASFLTKFPEVEGTRIVKTGRGAHFYFQWEEGIRNSSGMLGPRIDVRGEGSFLIVPPSVHLNGTIYADLNQNQPFPLPDSLREALNGRAKDHFCQIPQASVSECMIRQGERNAR